jgi:outer membrane protein OmpA-like peptidoglycan-associated protein
MKARANFIGKAILSVAAVLLFGCATEPSQTVLSARDAYQQAAQNDQITQNAPVKLYEAEQALRKLNTAVDDNEDTADIDHLAYMVEQRVEIAKAAARQKMASNQLEQLSKEQAQIRLDLRQAEAKRARERAEKSAMAAKQAQEKVSSLEQQLQQIKQATVHEEPRGVVLTLGDVFFDFGKATLKSGAEQNLNSLARFLKDNPQRNVVIEGYTDNVGSAAFNRQLSYERARAVIAYLSSQGIRRDRLVANGYGESFPVATNENPAGRQLNRRVEIVVLNEGQPPTTALRQTGAGEVETFSQLDRDKNGYLTKTETKALKALNNNFEQYDRNHDDRLSRSEFSAFEEVENQQQPEQQ